MNVFYVFEEQEVGPRMRIPMQFNTKQAALDWVARRKASPAFASINYTIEPDNPQADAEQAQLFNDA